MSEAKSNSALLERPPRPVDTLAEAAESTEALAQLSGQLESALSRSGPESYFSFVRRTLLEMTNIKFALASFVVNTLRRRYRRSVLGFAWSLLNPLLTMCVMTAIFSTIFHQSPKEFGVYIFTGLLPWSFFSDSVIGGSGAITGAEGFLKKVYIPKLFFPLVTVATEGANFFFSMVSLIILSTIVGVHLHASVLLVVPISALLFAFSFSIALFFAISTVYFRDLAHILRVFLGALFYTLPVIYPISMVPERFRVLYQFNPLSRFVELFRASVYTGQVPGFDVWLVPIVATVLALMAALYLLKRTERDLIFRL